MTFDATAYRAELARMQDGINRLMASMTPAERAGWDAICESMEYFDGETEIELGYLLRYLKDRRGIA